MGWPNEPRREDVVQVWSEPVQVWSARVEGESRLFARAADGRAYAMTHTVKPHEHDRILEHVKARGFVMVYQGWHPHGHKESPSAVLVMHDEDDASESEDEEEDDGDVGPEEAERIAKRILTAVSREELEAYVRHYVRAGGLT